MPAPSAPSARYNYTKQTAPPKEYSYGGESQRPSKYASPLKAPPPVKYSYGKAGKGAAGGASVENLTASVRHGGGVDRWPPAEPDGEETPLGAVCRQVEFATIVVGLAVALGVAIPLVAVACVRLSSLGMPFGRQGLETALWITFFAVAGVGVTLGMIIIGMPNLFVVEMIDGRRLPKLRMRFLNNLSMEKRRKDLQSNMGYIAVALVLPHVGWIVPVSIIAVANAANATVAALGIAGLVLSVLWTVLVGGVFLWMGSRWVVPVEAGAERCVPSVDWRKGTITMLCCEAIISPAAYARSLTAYLREETQLNCF